MTELEELIQQMEAINWSNVPTISTPEAAAFTQRLIEAREATEEREAELHAA